MLANPKFDEDFVLEADVSVMGLGAVLEQSQSDGFAHPTAYASHVLSPLEHNY